MLLKEKKKYYAILQTHLVLYANKMCNDISKYNVTVYFTAHNISVIVTAESF